MGLLFLPTSHNVYHYKINMYKFRGSRFLNNLRQVLSSMKYHEFAFCEHVRVTTYTRMSMLFQEPNLLWNLGNTDIIHVYMYIVYMYIVSSTCSRLIRLTNCFLLDLVVLLSKLNHNATHVLRKIL